MNLSAMITAARLALPLAPAAQRPLAEMLLNEAERINKDYDQLKRHVADLSDHVTNVTRQLNGVTDLVNSHAVALRSSAH